MRYLIIAPSWLGDIIMSQSLYICLKAQQPDCHIAVYAPAYARPILERMPQVDEILDNPFAHGEFALLRRYREGQRLRGQFDCAIVLPNSFKSALPAFFAGIKQRHGFKGESRYLVLNQMRTNKKDFPGMVQRYVALAYSQDKVKTAQDLPAFDYPSLTLNPPSAELLKKLGLHTDRQLLALGCGANYGPAKLWPVDYFAKISQWWIQKGGAVLGLGTKKDLPTIEAIRAPLSSQQQNYFYNIAGATALDEALDLVGACTLAVCNDSGMMHLVAAAGIPQVAIFGSTSTTYTPPLSTKAITLESEEPCHPCFKRQCQFNTYACLKKITPQQVIDKLSYLEDHACSKHV